MGIGEGAELIEGGVSGGVGDGGVVDRGDVENVVDYSLLADLISCEEKPS
jgi:hypothetical protein